nr:MAG TPA: hypothetical protein [Caudoviricetes sp.]
MWRGYEEALKLYQNITISEWIKRGYKNNMKFEDVNPGLLEFPEWLGNDEFHQSHRSNLLRKDFGYYSEFFDEPDNLEYIWPVQ